MQSRIKRLESCDNFKEGLRNACRANRISITILNGLTIKKIKSIYSRTLIHYESNPDKARNNWFENELRLFQWVLIIESFLTGQLLNQFSTDQWLKIQTYFPPKSLTIFQFETKKLLGKESTPNSRIWEPEECQLLTEIMKDDTLINRWNDVARQFYEMSGKRFYRSSKQCRQQWFNHLDDSKIHGSWQEHQDRLILEYVYRQGHKWAQICKEHLNHRTQHMIKNRFKSLLMKAQQTYNIPRASERKIIKKILANRIFLHENSITSKQLQSCQEQRQKDDSNGDQNELVEESVAPSIVGEAQIEENVNERNSIGNQIIEDGVRKQKQNLEKNEPMRPIPLVQNHFPFTNPLQSECPTRTSLYSQPNTPTLPYPFFTCFTPCFTFFAPGLGQMGQPEEASRNGNSN